LEGIDPPYYYLFKSVDFGAVSPITAELEMATTPEFPGYIYSYSD
jgi:hypothetical protein